MKIGVYGTGFISEECLKLWGKISEIDILFFSRTMDSKGDYLGYPLCDKSCIPWDEIDYLVVATNIFYNEIVGVLKNVLGTDYVQRKKKIIQFDDFNSAVLTAKKELPILSSRVEGGLIYIAREEDKEIPGRMRLTGENWAKDTMDAFCELTKKYYPEKNSSSGYLFDIGGNIGTTSIYMKKNNPMLKIIGFELTKENYDIFRANCILNGMEDIKVENLGLGDIKGEVRYNYCLFNSGGSGITTDISGEIAKVDTLDNYIMENGIAHQDINMLWIDVEGAECKVIKGAADTLSKVKIPILHEMSFNAYSEDDFREYYTIISETYSFFIDMKEYLAGHCIERPIRSIYEYQDKMVDLKVEQTDFFLG